MQLFSFGFCSWWHRKLPYQIQAAHRQQWPVLVKLASGIAPLLGCSRGLFLLLWVDQRLFWNLTDPWPWPIGTTAQKRPLKYSAFWFLRMDLPAQERWVGAERGYCHFVTVTVFSYLIFNQTKYQAKDVASHVKGLCIHQRHFYSLLW